MVAEQRETVQRIDADTFDIASNVGGAQRELLKYYANISSNRWLMLKVFGVLIVFVRSCLQFGGYIADRFAVLTFYLSFMMDFFQLWPRLAVVIYTLMYIRMTDLSHIDLTPMLIPGTTIQLVVRSHPCPSFLSVCRASFLLFSSHDARYLGPHHRQSKYV